MAKKQKSEWIDIVERLKELSNISPEEERQQLLEAAKQEPRILDDKDVSLADIAKLAGIKEYSEPKVSRKAEQLIESITQNSSEESVITKAIKETDADTSISKQIKKEVTEDSKRLDKIAELEAQLAELKSDQRDEQTHDVESFREVISKDVAEYIKSADESKLVELYNTFSENEAIYNEDQKNVLIKTAETKEIIADAEKNEEQIVKEIDKEIEEAGYEGQGEPHAHEITLAGDYDQENAVSDQDAQEIQSALKQAGIDAEVHPMEKAFNKVHVHTMASKDAVKDALGDTIDEQQYTDQLSD